MIDTQVLPYGDGAALVQCPRGLAVQLAAALRDSGRFREVVPAEQSVLVTFAPPMRVADVVGVVASLPADLPPLHGRDIEIPVLYNGEDLSLVAEATGLNVDEVIALHSGTTYDAAFAGFAPGYVYCTGLDPRLHLPRRPSPRVAVPAGSVAIADVYTAVYPQASPGGWHLLGTTDVPLFDLHADEPALIRPGDRVRFTVRTA